jgi:ketose-bisphosphate aldolase
VVDAALLRQLRAERRALIGFTIYNLEQGLGVVRAADAEGVPVLLQAGASAFGYAGREPLAALALGLARSAEVPVGVHLDHAHSVEDVNACLDLGYTSVMFDGSALPLESNIRITREVVTRAHLAGAWVEGELAGIPGDEDQSADAGGGAYTDPSAAARFVAATGVDALAVAVGNVHGMSAQAVSLDLDLLAEIARAVAVPLVLHGASGLPAEEVSTAIDLGVAKLNVNTELRRAFRTAVLDTAGSAPSGDGLANLMEPAIDAVEAAARDKLRAFTGARDGVA